jgi:hypothetical protein
MVIADRVPQRFDLHPEPDNDDLCFYSVGGICSKEHQFAVAFLEIDQRFFPDGHGSTP